MQEERIEEKPVLLNANQVAERLDARKATAYRIIKEPNEQVKAKGYKVFPGRICSDVLEEACFGHKKTVNHDG